MFLPLVVLICLCLRSKGRVLLLPAVEQTAPVIADKFGDRPLVQLTEDQDEMYAEDGAGPDTDCVNYMMQ